MQHGYRCSIARISGTCNYQSGMLMAAFDWKHISLPIEATPLGRLPQWICNTATGPVSCGKQCYLIADGYNSSTDFLADHELFTKHRQNQILPTTRRQTLLEPNYPLAARPICVILFHNNTHVLLNADLPSVLWQWVTLHFPLKLNYSSCHLQLRKWCYQCNELVSVLWKTAGNTLKTATLWPHESR